MKPSRRLHPLQCRGRPRRRGVGRRVVVLWDADWSRRGLEWDARGKGQARAREDGRARRRMRRKAAAAELGDRPSFELCHEEHQLKEPNP